MVTTYSLVAIYGFMEMKILESNSNPLIIEGFENIKIFFVLTASIRNLSLSNIHVNFLWSSRLIVLLNFQSHSLLEKDRFY